MKQQYILLFLLFFSKVEPISLVYAFRFTEITRPTQLKIEGNVKERKIGAASLFERYSKTGQGSHDNILAGFFTALYVNQSKYIRLDWAYGNVTQTLFDGTCFDATQTDDLLITFGNAWPINETFTMTLSGVAGFPTHADQGLQFTQLGTGHYGLGIQVDAAYNYSANKYHSILMAARYIRFLPRGANIETDNCKIIQRFNLDFGNLIDLYLSHYSDWNQHKLEFAYNATFFFGAKFCPFNLELERAFHFVRSSFIGAYSYGFLLSQHPSSLILAFSYGFDHGKRITRSTAVVYAVAAFAYSF